MAVFSPKTPDEQGPFTFDYSRLLGTGETLTSATVTCSVLEGTDATASAMISGSAAVIQGLDGTPGKAISQKVINGVLGNRYMLSCLATTSTGMKYTLQGDFYCLNQVG